MTKLNVGIVGASGYTGVELLRLLSSHPNAHIKVVTSRADQDKKVSDIFPNLRKSIGDITFSAPDTEELYKCDVVFFATPHAVAHNYAGNLLDKGIRVVDLSADFRIKNLDVWQKWYQTEHASPKLIEQAVYGLVELNRKQIKTAQLIAVPGCYPTATILGLLPLVANNLTDYKFIADCKSGVSGAGRKKNIGTLFAESSDSISAYAVTGHRHLPEITEVLSIEAKHKVNLTFVPHLTPMLRGIHATLYAQIIGDVDIQNLYQNYYQNEFFVDVLEQNKYPHTRNVRGSNHCQIAVCKLPASNQVVVMSVIDNLVKGAAGQAVQNMNVCCGFAENSGLCQVPLLP